MMAQRTSFLVEAENAVSIKTAAKALGLSPRYLQRQDTRTRLGLQLVRNRTNLDDRRIFLSKESVLNAIAGLGVGNE